MRFISLLLLSLLYACKPQSKMPVNTHQPISLASLREKYTIVRIDSIKHILIIYARKDAAVYKIVTRKDSSPCTPIRVGEAYEGVPVDFEKEWGNNIFYAVNLKGLCLQF
jgi:hypothetical protein